jgi:CheY-like chemotaxis protein
MPVMSGLELLGRIRADTPTVPIIVMTGRRDPKIQQVVSSHSALLLEKPFRPGELITSIESALAGLGPDS